MHKLLAFALGSFVGGFFGVVIGVLILLACQENGIRLGNVELFILLCLTLALASVAGLIAASQARSPRHDPALLADYDDRDGR
jgi:hypothetical protein